jgi:hypothetical protein
MLMADSISDESSEQVCIWGREAFVSAVVFAKCISQTFRALAVFGVQAV